MTLAHHPSGTYVGLYGSHGGWWRKRCKARLDAVGVPWHDPTDPRWVQISPENGDRLQGLVDELVAEEHQALLGCTCVIFHFTGGDDPPVSLAARYELGLLAGRGIPTFLHVEPEVEGRNYLWAAVKQAPATTICSGLEEALDQAIALVVEDGGA